jgi:hypothetical protein
MVRCVHVFWQESMPCFVAVTVVRTDLARKDMCVLGHASFGYHLGQHVYTYAICLVSGAVMVSIRPWLRVLPSKL